MAKKLVEDNLKHEFHAAMKHLCDRMTRELGYRPTVLLDMLEKLNGVKAAKMLLRKREVSAGFIYVYERGRPDLTVEALILEEKWDPLFTQKQREIARRRLDECRQNYEIKRGLVIGV
jgi:hypothetical protein